MQQRMGTSAALAGGDCSSARLSQGTSSWGAPQVLSGEAVFGTAASLGSPSGSLGSGGVGVGSSEGAAGQRAPDACQQEQEWQLAQEEWGWLAAAEGHAAVQASGSHCLGLLEWGHLLLAMHDVIIMCGPCKLLCIWQAWQGGCFLPGRTEPPPGRISPPQRPPHATSHWLALLCCDTINHKPKTQNHTPMLHAGEGGPPPRVRCPGPVGGAARAGTPGGSGSAAGSPPRRQRPHPGHSVRGRTAPAGAARDGAGGQERAGLPNRCFSTDAAEGVVNYLSLSGGAGSLAAAGYMC